MMDNPVSFFERLQHLRWQLDWLQHAHRPNGQKSKRVGARTSPVYPVVDDATSLTHPCVNDGRPDFFKKLFHL
jgi:hypothetical protein